MSMISNDRFPDVPMAPRASTPGTTKLSATRSTNYDGNYHGQNQITLGPNGGMSWQRARPGQGDTFHETGSAYPGNTVARPA